MNSTWHNETPYPQPSDEEITWVLETGEELSRERIEHLMACYGPLETEILALLNGGEEMARELEYAALTEKLTDREFELVVGVASCLEHAHARVIALFEIQSGNEAPEEYKS